MHHVILKTGQNLGLGIYAEFEKEQIQYYTIFYCENPVFIIHIMEYKCQIFLAGGIRGSMITEGT